MTSCVFDAIVAIQTHKQRDEKMTKRISDVLFWNIKTKRPADNPDAVSIAELAQFVEVDPTQMYALQRAYDVIRSEYSYEIREGNCDYYVDFDGFCAVFGDGSTLTVTR